MVEYVRRALRGEWPRLRLRLLMVRDGALAALFWPVALGVGIALDSAGLAWLGYLLLLGWVLLALPSLVVQLMGITDLLLYALTRRIVIMPGLTVLALGMAVRVVQRSANKAEREPPRDRSAHKPSRWAWLLEIPGLTMPTSMVARWCYAVLARAPASAWAFDLRAELARLEKALVDTKAQPEAPTATKPAQAVEVMIYYTGRSYMGPRWPQHQYASAAGVPL